MAIGFADIEVEPADLTSHPLAAATPRQDADPAGHPSIPQAPPPPPRARSRSTWLWVTTAVLGFLVVVLLGYCTAGSENVADPNPSAFPTSSESASTETPRPPPSSPVRTTSGQQPTPTAPTGVPQTGLPVPLSPAKILGVLLALAVVGLFLLAFRLWRASQSKTMVSTTFVSVNTGAAPYPVLAGRVAVGSQARRLSESVDGIEAHLKGWIEKDTAHDYHLVRIVCSFTPEAHEFIATAQISARLQASGTNAADSVIWSLWPKSLTRESSTKTTSTLGTDFKFISAEAAVERSSDESEELLIGQGELQQSANWMIRPPSEHRPLHEVYLAIITQKPRGSVVSLRIDVWVYLQQQSSPVTAYQASLPPKFLDMALS